ISNERRDGTLSLLFLTKLKGYEVVLGKLTGAGLAAAYALVAFLPTLALALLAGGVTFTTVMRTALALVNALFVSVAAGLWVSARARSRRKAMRNALLIILLIQVVPWCVVHAFARYGPGAAMFASASPYTAFHLAPDVFYTAARSRFWLGLLVPHVLGWLLLAWATAYLIRDWRAVEISQADRPVPIEPVM